MMCIKCRSEKRGMTDTVAWVSVCASGTSNGALAVFGAPPMMSLSTLRRFEDGFFEIYAALCCVAYFSVQVKSHAGAADTSALAVAGLGPMPAQLVHCKEWIEDLQQRSSRMRTSNAVVAALFSAMALHVEVHLHQLLLQQANERLQGLL